MSFDALCFLTVNSLNDKLFVLLWWWLIVLFSLTVVLLTIRLIMSVCPMMRWLILRTKLRNAQKCSNEMKFMLKALPFSDWLVLYSMSEKMQYSDFVQLLENLLNGEFEQEILMNRN